MMCMLKSSWSVASLIECAREAKDIITCTLIREIQDNIECAREAIDAFDLADESKFLMSAVNPYSDLVQTAELVRTVYEEVNTTRNKVEKHIYKLSRYENTNMPGRGGYAQYDQVTLDYLFFICY